MIDFACKRFDLNEVIKCGLNLTKSDYKILQYLVFESKDVISSEEISKKLKIDVSTAQRSLKKLRDQGLVHRSQINLSPGGYVYVYSAKNRNELKKMILEIVNNWSKKVEDELNSWSKK
ncbi:MAG: hypothetical protein QT05_C0006G0026 [archaeon GW2011_AR13]|nr:MAG: hypothetical protein QT05_C0006G0026 [archaeon GW2011_AR13]HIG95220.1 HTH domain-containing protein [Nanoarchaeota archaeon]HIH63101.1 HTH domain-containing protein [Nanoarchaeota archaeon]HIJ09156.1 HTH domain-containing protein [Nanoarchaeota archaeon]